MKKFYIYNSSAANIGLFPHIDFLPEIKDKTIVVISPHADDIAIGCGGAMVLLSKKNTVIPLLFFTGERGVDAPEKTDRIAIRELEMRQEAALLGLRSPVFLRLSSYEDDSAVNALSDVVRIADELIKLGPNLVFLPHEGDAQPRHRMATDMALRAIQRACSSVELFFYETSWHPFGPLDFNVGLVLDAELMKKKLEAIRAHRSQLKRTRFDVAAESLARFRAATVPEQHIQGYGASFNAQFEYLEVFLKKFVGDSR